MGVFIRAGRFAFLMLVVLWPWQAVSALDPDAQIDAFIAADGFTPVDPDYFWSEDWNGPHRFPHYDREGEILQADNGLSDAEKAILAIEALEQPVTHVRYKITSTEVPDQEAMLTYRFLEITRFNLGPTLLEDIWNAYEGVFTPSDEGLETSPHITWRFAFISNSFMRADPLAISRRELDYAAAQEHKCFALSCLDLADPVGEQWLWNDIDVDEQQYPAEYTAIDALGLTVPARIADLLLTAGEVQGAYEMVISSSVAGQDDTANGIIRYNRFLADEVSSDWIVRREVGGVPPFWGQIRTSRMAGDPVWNLPHGFDPGRVEASHVAVEGLDAWKGTLEFDVGAGEPIRYDIALNREVATYRSDHWMYLGLSSFPAFVYARDPHGGMSLPLLGRGSAASAPMSGWYGLPGSPFAGRTGQFATLWQAVGWDLEGVGLIVAADITIRDGLVESDLRPILAGSADVTTLDAGQGHQTVRIRLRGLAPDASFALATIFPDMFSLGSVPWPFDLPAQPVPILERF